jgi:antitoxin component of MazEF toxin-antitoxin module
LSARQHEDARSTLGQQSGAPNTQDFCEEISVREGDLVEMNIAKGRPIIAPRPPRDCHLADLVAEIRPGNLHKETVVQGPKGKEVW